MINNIKNVLYKIYSLNEENNSKNNENNKKELNINEFKSILTEKMLEFLKLAYKRGQSTVMGGIYLYNTFYTQYYIGANATATDDKKFTFSYEGLENYQNFLLEIKNFKPKSAGSYVRALKSFIKYLYEEKVISLEEYQDVKRYKTVYYSNREKVSFAMSEIYSILDSIPNRTFNGKISVFGVRDKLLILTRMMFKLTEDDISNYTITDMYNKTINTDIYYNDKSTYDILSPYIEEYLFSRVNNGDLSLMDNSIYKTESDLLSSQMDFKSFYELLDANSTNKPFFIGKNMKKLSSVSGGIRNIYNKLISNLRTNSTYFISAVSFRHSDFDIVDDTDDTPDNNIQHII